MAGNRVLVASSQTALKLQLALKKLQFPQTRTYKTGLRQTPAGFTPMMVKCIKDGGTSGGGGSTCDWTFTLKDLRTDVELATEQPKEKGWNPNVKYETPDALGVIGVAYRDVDGSWKLWDVKCNWESEECEGV